MCSNEEKIENMFKDDNEVENDRGSEKMPAKKTTTRKKPSKGVKKGRPKMKKPTTKKRGKK